MNKYSIIVPTGTIIKLDAEMITVEDAGVVCFWEGSDVIAVYKDYLAVFLDE